MKEIQSYHKGNSKTRIKNNKIQLRTQVIIMKKINQNRWIKDKLTGKLLINICPGQQETPFQNRSILDKLLMKIMILKLK